MTAFDHCLNSFSKAFAQGFDKNIPAFMELLDVIAERNICWITVGKSVPVALTNIRLAHSFGVGWTVIDAAEAWHGDFGKLKEKHIIGYITKSGNTEEIITTAEYLGPRDSFAITSNPDADILKFTTEESIIIPIEDEGSPWNHAPFVSTPLYLIIMNALLAEVIERRGITKEDYFFNHPGGQIGKDLKKELN